MNKVIAIAEVDDAAEWEAHFRTHGELFRRQTLHSPIYFTAVGDHQVIVCFEPEDLETYMEILESPETASAMAVDGINRETIKFHVLDKSFNPG